MAKIRRKTYIRRQIKNISIKIKDADLGGAYYGPHYKRILTEARKDIADLLIEIRQQETQRLIGHEDEKINRFELMDLDRDI